jgi:selenocysteine lyase/cysteine desulfurase
MKPIRIMAAAYPAPRARPGSCERRRPGGPVYGPRERASLIAFNRAGTDPFTVVKPSTSAASRRGRAATAPRWPTTRGGSTRRLNFAVYNNEEDVDRAVDAVASAP